MAKGVYERKPFSAEHRAKLSAAGKGRRHSEETKRKMSLKLIGNQRGIGPKPEGFGAKISAARKGQPSPLKGKRIPVEARFNHQAAQRRRVAEGRHNWWRGGIYKSNLAIRGSLQYRLWRKAVFERDDYTCVFCIKRGGILNADHIKPFALFPELRFDLSNGRTLCVPCHKTTDTFAGRTHH